MRNKTRVNTILWAFKRNILIHEGPKSTHQLYCFGLYVTIKYCHVLRIDLATKLLNATKIVFAGSHNCIVDKSVGNHCIF